MKGRVWDLVQTPEGRVEIARLPVLVGPDGQKRANDVFANDRAAREFVERLAELGNVECQQALMDCARDVDWWAEEKLAGRRSPLTTMEVK